MPAFYQYLSTDHVLLEEARAAILPSDSDESADEEDNEQVCFPHLCIQRDVRIIRSVPGGGNAVYQQLYLKSRRTKRNDYAHCHSLIKPTLSVVQTLLVRWLS
jgi:hypothetical protein